MHQIKAMIDLGLGMYACRSWSCPFCERGRPLKHQFYRSKKQIFKKLSSLFQMNCFSCQMMMISSS
jgi:hypothetical protein